jgi:hypothetical protein
MTPIRLHDIVDALDAPCQEIESFLDPETGEIIAITEDDRFELDNPDPDAIPEWQREHLAKIQQTLGTGRLLQLPSPYLIHEWSIMEKFSGSVADPEARQRLLHAIHGRGAFAFFRQTLDQLNLRDAWFAYRRAAFEEVAREWLESNNIPYE